MTTIRQAFYYKTLTHFRFKFEAVYIIKRCLMFLECCNLALYMGLWFIMLQGNVRVEDL